MVKKTFMSIIVGIFMFNAVFVTYGMCDPVNTKDAGKSASAIVATRVNNLLCPVTGEKVDMKNPVTVERDGKIYNLCCPMCIAEFKKYPAKYIAKIEAQKK